MEQSGRDALEASLYVLYGSATMIVVTLGDGVHGFTYDPRVGEELARPIEPIDRVEY